ncbi:Glycosyl transferase family 2 [anaerobic digester metagenome]
MLSFDVFMDIYYRLRKCFEIGTFHPLWRLGIFRWRLLWSKFYFSPVKADSIPSPGSKDCPNPGLLFEKIEAVPAEVPEVSVVIPCYNYGSFIHEAVDSVLAQTLQQIEITIVDGGSNDGFTLGVLSRLNRPRTRIIYQSAPTFVGVNRNLGIAASRGRYVCCLDADDRLKPTYLEKTVALLKACDFDLVSAGYEILGRPGDVLLNMPAPLLEDMLLGNHMLTCAVFSRALFSQTGGFVDTGKGAEHVAEDWRLWVHMAALGARMRNIMEPLLEYRIHEDRVSLSREVGAPAKWMQAKKICEALEKIITPEALAYSRSRAGRCLNCRR